MCNFRVLTTSRKLDTSGFEATVVEKTPLEVTLSSLPSHLAQRYFEVKKTWIDVTSSLRKLGARALASPRPLRKLDSRPLGSPRTWRKLTLRPLCSPRVSRKLGLSPIGSPRPFRKLGSRPLGSQREKTWLEATWLAHNPRKTGLKPLGSHRTSKKLGSRPL